MLNVHELSNREGEWKVRGMESQSSLREWCFWSWFSSQAWEKFKGCVLIPYSRVWESHSQLDLIPWSHGYVSVCRMLCHLLSPTPNIRDTQCNLSLSASATENTYTTFWELSKWTCISTKERQAVRFFFLFSFVHIHISVHTEKTEENKTEEHLHVFFNSWVKQGRL